MGSAKSTIRVHDAQTKNIYGGNLYKATVMEWTATGRVLLTIDLGLSIKTEMECQIHRVSQVPEELAAYLQREFPPSTQIVVSTIPKRRSKRAYLVELWTYKLPPDHHIPVWTERKKKHSHYSDLANINDWILSLEKG
jgi:hypothetical protein